MKRFRLHWLGKRPSKDTDSLAEAAYLASLADVNIDAQVLKDLDALEVGGRYTDCFGDVWVQEE